MNQYEIEWTELPKPEISTAIRGIPIEVPLGPSEGMPKLPPTKTPELKRAPGYALNREEVMGLLA